MPRKADDDCLKELRWLYDRCNPQEAERALAAETHEGWLEEHRYLSMQLLAEQKKEQLRQLDEAA